MSVEAAIRSILINDSNFNGIIKTKLFPRVVTQAEELPYAIYLIDEIEPNHSKTAASSLDFVDLTFVFLTNDYSTARSLADYARAALDFYKGTVEGETIQRINIDDERNGFDDKSETYFIEQDYKVYIER